MMPQHQLVSHPQSDYRSYQKYYQPPRFIFERSFYNNMIGNHHNHTQNYTETELDHLLSYQQLEGLNIINEIPDHQLDMLKGSGSSKHCTISPKLNGLKTSNVVHDVLCYQELCRAGILFTLSHDVLLADFPMTIELLKKIIDCKSYASNINQQSIVEIVLTKCISALKETELIVNYYEDLLELLEICLKYSLSNNNSSLSRNSYRLSALSDSYDKERQFMTTNTPHANIVSDILSCILLNYLDPDLSEKAVPVCVKLLQHHNIKPELVKEISSYLNLVACRSSEILVDYVYYILNAILKGHTSLTQLLYQICESQPECIYPLVKHLIKALKLIDLTSDLVYILQIMNLVSLNHVHLVIVHLDDLINFIGDEICQEALLDILFSISNQVPIALEPYIVLLENPKFSDSYKVDKIIGTVGKSLRKMSEYCTNLLLIRIKHTKMKSLKQSNINKRLSECNKENKHQHEESMNEASCHEPTRRSYLGQTEQRRNNHCNNKSYSYSNHSNEGNEGNVLSNGASHLESKSVANVQKRYIQILNEIYEIAQIFPNVLDMYYKKLFNLFPNPSENISFLLQKIRQSKSENSSMVFSKDDLKESTDKLENESSFLISKDGVEKSGGCEISGIKSEQFNSKSGCNNEFRQNEDRIVELINNFDTGIKIIDNYEKPPTIVPINAELRINEHLQYHSITSIMSPQSFKLDDLSIQEKSFDFTDEKIFDTVENAARATPEKSTSECNLLIKKSAVADEETNDNLIDLTNLNEKKTTLTQNSFLNGLKRQMEYTNHPISSTIRIQVFQNDYANNRDVIENFCSKHMEKIIQYIKNVEKLVPIPMIDLIYDSALNRTLIKNTTKPKSNSKKQLNLKFACNAKSEFCLFSENYFELTTNFPTTWIHLTFLALQAHSQYALRQKDNLVIELKFAYESLNEKISFVTLLTSSFPSEKQINELKSELIEFRSFDLIEYQCFSERNSEWMCYMCAHPEKAADFMQGKQPVIQGELKEKHGKWKLLKKWRKRLFSLTGGSITYFKKDMRQESLNVRYIRNIQTMQKMTKSNRNILKAFEIFTDKNSFILKPDNSNEAEQWIRYLQLSKILENNRSQNAHEENSMYIRTYL